MLLDRVIRKIGRYVGPWPYRLVRPTTLGHLGSLWDLSLLDLIARLYKSHLGKNQLRLAVVGDDPLLLGGLEATFDCGLSCCHRFGNKDENPFFPVRAVKGYLPTDYDLTLIAGRSEAADGALCRALSQRLGPDAAVHMVLFRALRAGVLGALSAVRPEHFRTCLNGRKLVAVGLALAVSGDDGCVVECGSYRGGTSVFMGLLLRWWRNARRIHAIDTFAGMPRPSTEDGDTIYQSGMFGDTALAQVTKHVEAHSLQGVVRLHKGLVQEQLPAVWQQEGLVSLALIDTDQYQGTVRSLEQILPRLKTNGLILVDDCCLDGVRRAIDEVRAAHQILRGVELTHNLYALWGGTDREFLSTWWMRRALGS